MQFGKYTIPKGALVMMSWLSIHNNPEYWPHPDVFEPERFIKASDVS